MTARRSRRVAVVLLLVACRWSAPAQATVARFPVPAAHAGAGCTVQVRFWDMGRGFHHAYILTSDGEGVTHFRAGPKNPGPWATRVWAWLRNGGPKARRWGPLYAEHGPYGPGTPDYDAGAAPSMTVAVVAAPCRVVDLRLSSAEIALNAARLPYDPVSTNSNAFVTYALGRIGMPPGPPPVAAPGWGTRLPVATSWPGPSWPGRPPA